jgi:hypothetical protein
LPLWRRSNPSLRIQPDVSADRRRSRVRRIDAVVTETIGHSVRRRPLLVHQCGRRDAALRIFILAGQHGDEFEARHAAAQFLESRDSVPGVAAVAILADANPDGAADGTRRNAADTDLNRDHQLLTSPETAAVHRFVEQWRPNLIIDVHTYRPRRPELLQHGFVFAQDVMIDVPTNPAACVSWPRVAAGRLIEFVARHLQRAGRRCDRYTLIRSGIVRHSSFDIVDARNGLSLRFGIPTVLLEGRRSGPEDGQTYAPSHEALQRAIQAVIDWAAAHPQLFRRHPAAGLSAGERLPVRCDYGRSTLMPTRYMELQSVRGGDIGLTEMPGPYFSAVRATRVVRVPRGYAVPDSCVGLLDVLARHRFTTVAADRMRNAGAEARRVGAYACARASTDRLLSTSPGHLRSRAEAYTVFPTNQAGGRLLVLLLEPDSQFGAHRYPELGVPKRAGAVYPVLRLV